jgi:LPXTG-motif cell wall-anchored protein
MQRNVHIAERQTVSADAVAVTVEIVPSPAPAPVFTGPLPKTGGDIGALVALAFVLIVVGALALSLARVRLERTHV